MIIIFAVFIDQLIDYPINRASLNFQVIEYHHYPHMKPSAKGLSDIIKKNKKTGIQKDYDIKMPDICEVSSLLLFLSYLSHVPCYLFPVPH